VHAERDGTMERGSLGRDGGRIGTAWLLALLMSVSGTAWASDETPRALWLPPEAMPRRIEHWQSGVLVPKALPAIAPGERRDATGRLVLHYGIGAGLDLLSTEWGMAQGPRVVEGNPLLHSQPVRVGSKVLEVAAAVWVDKKVSAHNRKVAAVLRWVYLATRVAIAAHNVHVGLEERRQGTPSSR